MAIIIKPFQRHDLFSQLGPKTVNRLIVDGCLTGDDREAGTTFVANRQFGLNLRLNLTSLIMTAVIGVGGIGMAAFVGLAVADYQHRLEHPAQVSVVAER